MKTRFALALTLGLTMAPAFAKTSCEDLTHIANLLDEVAAELQKGGTISEGSTADKDLRIIVDGLGQIASVEKDAGLDNSVKSLDKAWHAMDMGNFQTALDSVIRNLDRLNERDCHR